MRETCQLLIVVPLPGFVPREDNSVVPACTAMQLKPFCSLGVQQHAHLAAQVFVTMYFQPVQHNRVHYFAWHFSNYIAVHRQELPTPLTQCRSLNTDNYV